MLVLKILNFTSAALCFIYNWKAATNTVAHYSHVAGKKLFTRFPKAQSINRGFSYCEMKDCDTKMFIPPLGTDSEFCYHTFANQFMM